MKQKMTKFLLVMLTLLLGLSLTACGGDDKNVDNTERNTVSPQNSPSGDPGNSLPQNSPSGDPGNSLPPSNENTGNVIGLCKGIWLGTRGNDYGCIEFNAEGEWLLITDGYNVVDEGYLWYDEEWDVTYFFSNSNETFNGGRVELDGDELHISTLGYFTYSDGTEDYWKQFGDGENESPSGNSEPIWSDSGDEDQFYSWDTELRQRNVREFEGVWYYEGDLSAMMYIVIDGNGNWSWYERAVGEAEGVEMDYGEFFYSTVETSTYYAESSLYDNLSYRVVEYDIDTLVWDDSVFYRMG